VAIRAAHLSRNGDTDVTARQWPPALVTMLTLACGLAALEAASAGRWTLAFSFVVVAAVTDGFDGSLARSLGASSAMGAQLDSLADIVAFGVAPAFLFAAYFTATPEPVRYGAGLVFVLAGAYRLARFQVQPVPGVFQGLPITAAGSLFAATVAGPLHTGSWGSCLFGVGLAALMVCRHPFPKPLLTPPYLLAATAIVMVSLAVRPRFDTLTALMAFGLIGYLALGVVDRWGSGGTLAAAEIGEPRAKVRRMRF